MPKKQNPEKKQGSKPNQCAMLVMMEALNRVVSFTGNKSR